MSQIDFLNITKQYGSDTEVLKDVSFSVDNGEFVFLVGPSGAGKSTLIKVLIREEVPTSGDILFNGESVLQIPQTNISDLRRRIGVVFQDFKLLESKNIFDNVAVALDVVDSDPGVIRNVVPNVLAMVGLSNKMYNYPKQLSGGEKQRVAIARALAHEPDVLVADEPTGMIDPVASEEVVDILEKIHSLGTTVLMATHSQAIVDRLKKRVIRIQDGIVKSDKMGGKYND
ncbi:MAG: cell division ATPase, cell division transport system ATP-binding protein [candidate division WWE3 bacterium GW2011_GWC1_41_7]|uniref:Cell division ATP-binding protein FtsE n=4 Tax=Katanobacteria TaxID=422282 RepID=A0A0G0X983_UNCKA|nr:MAG: Cell division ATP-binding protein FtsE [candidate division WWE3 bacterium GW2011_GWB1_41_6]KKS19612.1 MAG: cell division ATPase, cell division transport system ATP-binding protein [candidate division WWE3 bacterium GW2011_GWC1_41_7]KKS20942.1 MAG: Cell division ATP-binding protein FtsE [candidate division WWE3 bacterium GW2011_GWA1_41_8]OGC57284.1 MAG: cell division ATP-binding protein FtsE [candidate division WWE3 bacterium RIFCSPLOWO2_01_FULL_41_9]